MLLPLFFRGISVLHAKGDKSNMVKRAWILIAVLSTLQVCLTCLQTEWCLPIHSPDYFSVADLMSPCNQLNAKYENKDFLLFLWISIVRPIFRLIRSRPIIFRKPKITITVLLSSAPIAAQLSHHQTSVFEQIKYFYGSYLTLLALSVCFVNGLNASTVKITHSPKNTDDGKLSV